MVFTPYDKPRAKRSNRAHLLARTELYPKIFKVPFENLSFDEDTLLETGEKGQVLDGQMAIDRIVRVSDISGRLRKSLPLTVQERFRGA